MPRSRLPPFLKLFPSSRSACLCQVSRHVRRHAVLDLGVSDGAVLLSEMQTELTLVAEVQVAFLTLKRTKKNKTAECYFEACLASYKCLKGALRSFGEEDQTRNINIYNVNVVIIQFIYSVTE